MSLRNKKRVPLSHREPVKNRIRKLVLGNDAFWFVGLNVAEEAAFLFVLAQGLKQAKVSAVGVSLRSVARMPECLIAANIVFAA
jgi:hypothetical protein